MPTLRAVVEATPRYRHAQLRVNNQLRLTPSTVSPLAVRVNLNSDEATSTAFPLGEAGVVSRNSRASRLYQYCLLARNQNSRMPTHFARGRRGYPRQCLAQHAGLRVNNELGLRPQNSLPSSSVLDCGLTLTRTVLEAAHAVSWTAG